MDTVPTFGSKKGSKKPKKSKGIASQKIAAMTKGSDKLAKAAEEQSAKVLFQNMTLIFVLLCSYISKSQANFSEYHKSIENFRYQENSADGCENFRKGMMTL